MPKKSKKIIIKEGQRAPKKFKPMIPKPPQFDSKIGVTKKFRYQCNTTGTAEITFIDLMFVLSIPISGTNINSALCAFKLKRVEIWQQGTVTGGPGTVSIQVENTAVGGIGAKPIILTDTSYNANTFARLTYVPTKMTTQGSWQNVVSTSTISSGGATISVAGNAGDILDITMDIILNTGTALLVEGYTQSIAAGSLFCPNIPIATKTWTSLQIVAP